MHASPRWSTASAQGRKVMRRHTPAGGAEHRPTPIPGRETLSQLSFAFLLISYFVREKNDLLLRYSDELIYIEKKNEEYYLGLLEKVAPKETDNKIK